MSSYSSLPLVAPFLVMVMAHYVTPLPLGASSVRVSFSSPSQSYQHGHNILQDSGHVSQQVLVSSPVTYPPSVRLYSHSRALGFHPETHLTSETHLNPEYLHESRSLEVSPLLDETLVQDIEPTAAELQDLIARFAHNPPTFFSTFPHQRSLLANIELRNSQHLPELRLGSIRPGSPFLRA